jgi:hypothetical protein
MLCSRLRLLVVLVAASGSFTSATTAICLAQATEQPTIRVETREVVLPVEVIEARKDPKGLIVDRDGTHHHIYMLHSQEVTGLSAKSFHVFEDGAEQRIAHLSVEKLYEWLARDNVGQHVEYSCTPTGVWGGPDTKKIEYYDESRIHTYLLTYVPPSSPIGTCHHVTLQVDHRHATIFAPDQYCNTANPLSDPVKGTDLGERLLEFANSQQAGALPLAVQLSSFSNTTSAYRVNVSAEIPADLLERKWEGNNLRTSIAILGLVYDKSDVLASRFSDTACVPPESTLDYDGPLQPSNAPIAAITEELKWWEDFTIPATYQRQVELGSGDYRLELVITDGAKFGRASASLKLDDLANDRLAISGIAICKRYRPARVGPRSPSQAPQYVPLVFNGTEFTPTGDTRFHKGEHFNIFVEVFGAQLEDGAATQRLQVRVVDAKTGEIKLDSGLQSLKFSTPPKNHSPSVVREVSTDTLQSGAYHLEAQVSESEGQKTAWTSVSLTIE